MIEFEHIEDQKYFENKKTGVWTIYDDLGTLMEKITFENDEKNGLYELYNDEGNTIVISGNYVNGKEEGAWKEFSNKGKLKKEINYKEGVVVK